MLLVLTYSSVEELQKYREALKEIGLNIHTCSILAIVESKKEKNLLREVSSVAYCSPQEINFLGQLKNVEANKVLAEKYDMLLVIGDLNKKVTKLIKKASVKIGIGVNSNVEFLTINLNSKSPSPSHLLNFVKLTVEKIK